MTSALQALAGHKFLSVTTYRKSGEAVATAVWFVQVGEKIYVWTEATSGKVKRLRNRADVELAPCNSSGKLLGAAFKASGRIVSQGEDAPLMAAMKRKYSWQFSIFSFLGRKRQHVFLEFTAKGDL